MKKERSTKTKLVKKGVFGKTLRKPKLLFPDIKRPRMDMPLPGKSIAAIVVYIALFLLQTGIVYLIIRQPPALGSNQKGEPMFLYPDINESFIIEGIVASIFIFLCSLGFILLLYQASKYVYNKNIAIRYLILGILLIVIAFATLQAMITIKLGEKLFNV
jgi:lysylphosphatidylglycerol synthetase-like protein (DUF2156 family)